MNKRLFLALDLNTEDKQYIEQWRQQHCNLPYKATVINNLHITLTFLGLVNTEIEQQLIDLVDQYHQQNASLSPQKLILDHIDGFKKPKVLYLGVNHTPDWLAKLARLTNQLTQQLAINIEARDYTPHLTLYRKAKVTHFTIESLTLNITSFSLYYSFSTPQGVCYQPIKTWPLFTIT